jgi:hypothetical protein
MSIVLAPGVVVDVIPPDMPVLQVGTPSSSVVTILPVAGPPGPAGPPGVSSNASCVWPQALPTYLVQVTHNMGFYPAGITAVDTSGYEVEYAGVTYVSDSIAEVTFDVLFSGTIYMS